MGIDYATSDSWVVVTSDGTIVTAVRPSKAFVLVGKLTSMEPPSSQPQAKLTNSLSYGEQWCLAQES